MISLKQINDKVVKPIPIPDIDKRPVRGYEICPEPYANIFACAKKKKGKTSVINTILGECSGKKTIIIIFCSTVYKDKNWIQIRRRFEKKGMDVRIFTSIYEDGEDQLDKLINELNEDAREQEEGEEVEDSEGAIGPIHTERHMDKCDEILERLANMYSPEKDTSNTKKKRKERASKYLTPEYIIVLDDLSNELKSRSLLFLLKKNRHYKIKFIISSQWVNDLLPESRKQIDLWIVFAGLQEKKILEIYKDCDSSVPFENFYNMYKIATKNLHSFLYIDTQFDEFRCNFNKQFIIQDPTSLTEPEYEDDEYDEYDNYES